MQTSTLPSLVPSCKLSINPSSLRSPSLQFPAGVETAVRRMKIIQRVPLNHTLQADTQYSIFTGFSNFKLHMYMYASSNTMSRLSHMVADNPKCPEQSRNCPCPIWTLLSPAGPFSSPDLSQSGNANIVRQQAFGDICSTITLSKERDATDASWTGDTKKSVLD